MSYLRILLFSFLFVVIPLTVFSQSDRMASPPATDTLKSVEQTDRHALYAGGGYGSNMIYLGSTISQSQPFNYAALAYSFKNELTVSASAFQLCNFDPLPAFCNFSLNYSHSFNSWFDFSAGAYRYQVNPSLSDTLFSSFTYGDVTLGIDLRLVYSQFSVGGLMIKDPQPYFQIKNSRYFMTPSFFKKKAFISFDPYVNLLFGTMIKSETYNGTTIITTTQQYTSPLSPTGTGSGAGTGSGNGTGSGSGSGTGSGMGSPTTTPSTTTTTTTTTSTVPVTTTTLKETFDLIEIEVGLPVAFNLNFMTIEAEASYVLPAYSDPYFPGPKGFVFFLSAFIKIF